MEDIVYKHPKTLQDTQAITNPVKGPGCNNISINVGIKGQRN